VERFHHGAQLATTLTPPSLIGERDRETPQRPDVATAARLLGEAGVHKLPLTVYFATGRNFTAQDQVLFAPLVEAGLVELTHVELSSTEYFERARSGRIPLIRSGWIADYPDPDNLLYFLLHSGAQTVYGLGYRNEEFDRLTAEARVSIDPALRQSLYQRAERIVYQDCPLVPLYHEQIHAAASPQVQGLRLQQIPPQVRFERLWQDRLEAGED
jgi:ABC-type oligopeptide transport system substrate-binding subunit